MNADTLALAVMDDDGWGSAITTPEGDAWKQEQGRIRRRWNGRPHPFRPQGSKPPLSLWCAACTSGDNARTHLTTTKAGAS